MLHAIDGSILEGGGQILRCSMTLACLLQKSISITSIRSGRPKPGLSAQHLTGARLIQSISAGSSLIGAELGSTELVFHPGDRLCSDSYQADCETAGSVTLMVQSSLSCLALTSSIFQRHIKPDNGAHTIALKLEGGTNVSASPPVDHLKHVLLPLLARHCGIKASVTIERRGYYPRGGGRIQLSISPVNSITPIILETQGSLIDLCAVVYGHADDCLLRELEQSLRNEFHSKPLVAKDGSMVSEITIFNSSLSEAVPDIKSEAITESMRDATSSSRDRDESSNRQHNQHRSSHENTNIHSRRKVVMGIGCQLWAHTSSGAILSVNIFIDTKTLGHDLTQEVIERLAKDVSTELRTLALTGACVDEYTADQLVLYMALAGGDSHAQSSLLVEPVSVHSSLHIETAVKITSDLSGAQFTFQEVSVDGENAKNRLLRCAGFGFMNNG